MYGRALGLLGGVTILDFDRGAAERYGALRLTLERAGIRLADPDLRIASIAAASERLLVTGNLKHFARVPGLRAADWIHQ